eukprot:CAMPEP_0198138738 /NCGR_PEP_ID=MMETSP1443-20131203/2139_1 /TAXON_ID=186043 /ORGANISM="Entomoneis sp., Strain CCMP2396" /LENGTH=337 /DNA_ID=CAMNT_0043800647 /DNA_START=212 /DNA_END=1225 /DNA_ORIENTATION=+
MKKQSNFSISSSFCLGVVLYNVLTISCQAEDPEYSIVTEDETASSEQLGVAAAKDSPEETEIIAFFCVVLAILSSLVGMCLVYFAVLEDGLMRIYTENGIDLRATVIETTFGRAAATGAVCGEQDGHVAANSEKEYNVLIEYKLPYEKCLVTKQVKALESDLAEGSHIPRSIKLQTADASNSGDIQLAASTMQNTSQCDDDTYVIDKKGLDIFVLAKYPTSGIPQKQAERACSIQYRLPTAILVLFLFTMTTCCLRFGIGCLISPTAAVDLPVGLCTAAAIATTILLIVELLCIHNCLGDMFRSALREMYLESGECFAPSSWEDTSISTKDDSYLLI